MRKPVILKFQPSTQVKKNGSVYGRVSGRSNADRPVIKNDSHAAV